MTSYKPVQSVERALLLLEQLNQRPVTRVRDLATATHLSHSTVIRLVETLEAMGYVHKVDRGAGYCVTGKTAGLSAGNHGFPLVLDRLRARADWLTKTLLWPAAISTLDGDAMVVRYSTIPQSPLAHIHSTINHRLSLLRRAHGRAYLAFCPQEEREHLIQIIETLPKTPPDFSRDELLDALEAIRISGFARRAASLSGQTNSIAVPYWWKGRLVATLGLTYFTRSVPDPSQLVRALKQASAGAWQPNGAV
jgi:IclR family transcriptional regulator, mhp operon transcriptional activator